MEKDSKKIIRRANSLIKELINQGYDLRARSRDGIIPRYLSFHVEINDPGSRNQLDVESVTAGWGVNGKCTAEYPPEWIEEAK
jgi:hypothetical protein